MKEDYIVIMGGLRRFQIDTRTNQLIDHNYKRPVKAKYIKVEQQVDSSVYMYS